MEEDGSDGVVASAPIGEEDGVSDDEFSASWRLARIWLNSSSACSSGVNCFGGGAFWGICSGVFVSREGMLLEVSF